MFNVQIQFFFDKKLENALNCPSNGQFQEKFTKKNWTHFLLDGDFFFVMADVYV